MLSHDTCLLITKDSNIDFNIIELQTSNTLNIDTEILIIKKEVEIIKIVLKAKSQIMLKICILEDFNRYQIIIENESIIVVQKNQVKKLLIINIRDNTIKK